jgi:hypothetical protein
MYVLEVVMFVWLVGTVTEIATDLEVANAVNLYHTSFVVDVQVAVRPEEVAAYKSPAVVVVQLVCNVIVVAVLQLLLEG